MNEIYVDLEDVVKDLQRREKSLDEILRYNREIVRACAGGIRLIHQNKMKEAVPIIKQIDVDLQKLKKHGPEFNRYYLPVEQEYAEFVLLYNLIEGKPIPNHKTLGINYVSYLNGMMDCVGELRRHMLDSITKEDLKSAKNMFELMEQLHDVTLPLNFSRALLPNFKQKQDVSRRQVEYARSELTHAIVSMKKR